MTVEVSIVAPKMPVTGTELEPVGMLVRDHPHFHRLWQGQGYGLDPTSAFAHLAARDCAIPVGFGVVTTPRRHPHDAALAARTLAVLTGHTPIYGIGPASKKMQLVLRGSHIEKPIHHTAEYILSMKAALGCLEPSDHKHSAFNRIQPLDPGDPLPYLPGPPVKIGVGVLRPGMARLVGRLAHAAITWLTPPRYVHDVIAPALRQTARSVDRPVPRLVAYVPVAVARNGRNPLELAQISAGGHLALEHYAAMATQAGIHLQASTDDVMRSLISVDGFLYGSASDIADGIARYAAAGVDEVALHTASVASTHGLDESVRDLRDIANALSPRKEPS